MDPPKAQAAKSVDLPEVQAAKDIFACYRSDYAFPYWSIEEYMERENPTTPGRTWFDEDAQHSRIFYDEADLSIFVGEQNAVAKLRERVLRLATEREPVNLTMNVNETTEERANYSEDKLQEKFNWRKGYYGTWMENLRKNGKSNQLPPNIAILTRTPVIMLQDIHGNGVQAPRPSEERVPNKRGQIQEQLQKRRIWVLNSIGYAFDTAEQPDYKFYDGFAGNKAEHLERRYQRVFAKIVAAAIAAEVEIIVWNLIGTGAFQELFGKLEMGVDNFLLGIWLPAYERVLESWKEELLAANVRKIELMGEPFDPYKRRVEMSTKRVFGTALEVVNDAHHQFPRDFLNDGEFALDRALFVNAWDPWSIPGNGNFADPSLDGHMGRCTAIATLGWPKTNPHLLKEKNLVGVGRNPSVFAKLIKCD